MKTDAPQLLAHGFQNTADSLKTKVAASVFKMRAVLRVDKFDRIKSWQVTAPLSILCPCSNYTITADRERQTLNEESVFQLMLSDRTKAG